MSRISTSEQQVQELRAVRLLQQAPEKLLAKFASIMSILDWIQWSMACCLSNQIAHCSASGSRRQWTAALMWRHIFHESDKNERKRGSDEPNVVLRLEGEDVAGRVDVVVGGEECRQVNHATGNGLYDSVATEHQPSYPKPQLLSAEQTYCMWQPGLFWRCKAAEPKLRVGLRAMGSDISHSDR